MKKILLTAIMGAWATGAVAHAPLESTTPADQVIIAEVPSEVILNFKDDIRLTRVSTTHADHASVDLDLDGFDGFISDYSIPLQSMGSGVYFIEWRGLGVDGHALSGSFSFTVE